MKYYFFLPFLATALYLNGTLCLEWGPDTWQAEISGAEVLKSAYHLLEIENPYGSNSTEENAREPHSAPSRHYLTLGQELRTASVARFYMSDELQTYLLNLPEDATGYIDFVFHSQSKSYLVLVQKIILADGSTWEDSSLPEGVIGSEKNITLRKGLFYKTQLSCEIINQIDELDKLLSVLDLTRANLESVRNYSPCGLLVVDSDNNGHFRLVWNIDSNELYCPTLLISKETAQRIPVNLNGLAEKGVAIIGLGSVGSKMALSLARMGVSRFLLVDEDVFLSENVCRNALDWLNLGEHKVDAVKEKLLNIAAGVKVDTSKLNLTGQESPTALNGLLSKLEDYDLLIDATASSGVFNLLSAASKLYQKPLVWMEVYGGGIGGLIARSRPGFDPEPQTMRRIYAEYCLEVSTSSSPGLSENMVNYEVEDVEGNILAASDADVSVISAHATRLAVDTVLERNPSHFPYSMYLIGLEKGWVFEAPFSTIPISTDYFVRNQTEAPGQDNSSEILQETLHFLSQLLKKSSKNTTNSNEDCSAE
jgi:molybdopterin/thiamine biosynthesis adenylyltransferase